MTAAGATEAGVCVGVGCLEVRRLRIQSVFFQRQFPVCCFFARQHCGASAPELSAERWAVPQEIQPVAELNRCSARTWSRARRHNNSNTETFHFLPLISWNNCRLDFLCLHFLVLSLFYLQIIQLAASCICVTFTDSHDSGKEQKRKRSQPDKP